MLSRWWNDAVRPRLRLLALLRRGPAWLVWLLVALNLVSGLLPVAFVLATSTTAPSTSPPPRTRSSSPMPVLTRASAAWLTSLSAVTRGGSTLPAQLERRAAAGTAAEAADSSTTCDKQFHAPHSPHWPCHLLYSAPHSPQTKAVRDLAVLAMPNPCCCCSDAPEYPLPVPAPETGWGAPPRAAERMLSAVLIRRLSAVH